MHTQKKMCDQVCFFEFFLTFLSPYISRLLNIQKKGGGGCYHFISFSVKRIISPTCVYPVMSMQRIMGKHWRC